MTIFRSLKLFWIFSKINIQLAVIYRWGGLIWVINGSLSNLLIMYIWTLVIPDKQQIITYYLGVILMGRLTQTWNLEDLGEMIKDGSLAQTLLRPYHYIFELVSSDIGKKTNRLMAMVPYFLLLVFVFSSYISVPSVTNILLCLPAVFLGYIINLLLSCSVGLITNWTGDYDGVGRTFRIIEDIAAGYIIPFALLPIVLRSVLNFTPFRYFISFPLEIALGQSTGGNLLLGYAISVGWVVILYFIFKWLDNTSTRYFSAHGG